MTHLSGPFEGEAKVLVGDHPFPSFKREAAIDDLPPLEDKVVSQLLMSTTFQSAVGSAWRVDEKSGVPCYAPTTEDDFHIVPRHYRAAWMEATSQSCMDCHRDTLRLAAEFEEPRDWYGRVRGSDGIFSWHPFDPVSISHNGMARPVTMRKEFVEAGVVRQYRPGDDQFPDTKYNSLWTNQPRTPWSELPENK
jgi:hypothetical protein